MHTERVRGSAAVPPGGGPVVVGVAALATLVEKTFVAAGASASAAASVAAALVEAECAGLPSHGVMLVPMYVERIRSGSVAPLGQAAVVHEGPATVVLDAQHALGQVTGEQAMDAAVERAVRLGLGAASVRHGFHLGALGRFARQGAARGCVAIVMCNTRPLMPGPGGAEPLVGNNPLAIALPGGQADPVVLDMALSEVSMGRIRLAQAAGLSIPDTWATDSEGVPTTDPAVAVRGMLQPVAGAKGFGLAFVIDLLCGGLSGGASGTAVQPLYGAPDRPYDCSHLFLALNPEHFCGTGQFTHAVAAATARVRASRRVPGAAAVTMPGERSRQRLLENRDHVALAPAVVASLRTVMAMLKLSTVELAALPEPQA